VLESLLSPPAPTAGQRLSEVTAVRSRTRCRTRCRTRSRRSGERRGGATSGAGGGVAEAPAHKEIRSRGSAMHLLKSRPHSDEATRFHARLDNAAAPKSLLDPWAALARLFYFHRREIPFADGKCAPAAGIPNTNGRVGTAETGIPSSAPPRRFYIGKDFSLPGCATLALHLYAPWDYST
jgi:hypothetical protein